MIVDDHHNRNDNEHHFVDILMVSDGEASFFFLQCAVMWDSAGGSDRPGI